MDHKDSTQPQTFPQLSVRDNCCGALQQQKELLVTKWTNFFQPVYYTPTSARMKTNSLDWKFIPTASIISALVIWQTCTNWPKKMIGKEILLVFVDCLCSVNTSTTSQVNRKEGDLKNWHENKKSKTVGLTKETSSKGSFQNFAWKEITVYSTHNAQKLCFAHHYIGTLKPILFKYVQ